MKTRIAFLSVGAVFFLASVSFAYAQQPTQAAVDALAKNTETVLQTECFKVLRGFGLRPKNVAGSLKDINPTLACRLAKYLQAVRGLGCNPRITSGYRSTSEQATLYKRFKAGTGGQAAPPGSSCHEYGAAVDIINASKGNGCNAADGKFAAQYGIIFGYSSNPATPPDNRGKGKNHFQCIENKTSGASSCSKQVCGGLAPEAPPPSYNDKDWNPSQTSNDETEGVAERIQASESAIQQTDAPEGSSGGGSTGGGSSGFTPSGIESVFAPETATPSTQSTPRISSEDIFCSDEFGSSEEGCEDPLVRGLLGDELGFNTSEENIYGEGSEDTLEGGTQNDLLSSSDASCADPGSSVSRNDASCLQVGGTGGSDQNTPILPELAGGQSAVATIRDAPTLSQRLFGTSASAPTVSVEADAVNNPGQYVSFLYHRGDDSVPSNMYYDSYTQTYRYVGSNQEVPQGLVNFVFSDVAPASVAQTFSWDGVRRAALTVGRATLPSFGFTIPFTSLFSW